MILKSPTSRTGALAGLAAAALFGLSAPVAKRLLGDVTPQVLAGLLYLGAGLALSVYRTLRPSQTEAPITRQDMPRLLGLVLLGGVAGPLLMLLGLQRTSALSASLLLNLEAPFTIAIAVIVFKEHLGKRAGAAAGCIVLGAALLELAPGQGATDTLGSALLAGACLAWALDNNLTQQLSLRDPFAIVRFKTLAAGGFNLVLGLALVGWQLPSWRVVAASLGLGVCSYGVSVVLDAYALRIVGAAREAAYFATAPFIGALGATWIVGDVLSWADLLAMAVMAAGVALLLSERHAHAHAHEPLQHSHEHTHDAHHQHVHGPNDPPSDPHAHPHRHTPLIHDHPHVPDHHHRHGH